MLNFRLLGDAGKALASPLNKKIKISYAGKNRQESR